MVCVRKRTHNAPFHVSLQDYPSLALLGEKLAENNIFLIFAVTKRLYVIYKVIWFSYFILNFVCFHSCIFRQLLQFLLSFLTKNFTALIPGTTVEILDQDSKNVIQLIITAYNVSEYKNAVWTGMFTSNQHTAIPVSPLTVTCPIYTLCFSFVSTCTFHASVSKALCFQVVCRPFL